MTYQSIVPDDKPNAAFLTSIVSANNAVNFVYSDQLPSVESYGDIAILRIYDCYIRKSTTSKVVKYTPMECINFTVGKDGVTYWETKRV